MGKEEEHGNGRRVGHRASIGVLMEREKDPGGRQELK